MKCEMNIGLWIYVKFSCRNNNVDIKEIKYEVNIGLCIYINCL